MLHLGRYTRVGPTYEPSEIDPSRWGGINPWSGSPALPSARLLPEFYARKQSKAMVKFDDDGSGQLDLDEFKVAVAEMTEFRTIPPAQVARVFRDFDVDRSGTIDVSELKAAVNALGIEYTDQRAAGNSSLAQQASLRKMAKHGK